MGDRNSTWKWDLQFISSDYVLSSLASIEYWKRISLTIIFLKLLLYLIDGNWRECKFSFGSGLK